VWALTVLVAALSIVAFLHLSGTLTPFYHRMGWHSLAGHSPDAHAGHAMPSGQDHSGMAGMPGMENMPGMDMPGTPSPSSTGPSSKLPGYTTVTISPERQQLIGVRTGKVQRDRLKMKVRAVGIIEPDQTRLAQIHTRVKGWVTKVDVNFVGQNVHAGDPLLELYSPELLSTQEEYLIARGNSGPGGLGGSQQRLVESSQRRLELMGVPKDEIADLERTKKVRDTMMLRSPISGRVLDRNVVEGSYIEPATELYRIADLSVVWLQAKIYEYELPHVGPGQPVSVTLLTQPDKVIEGKVAFIEPIVQEMTRTIKVRVEIPNPQDTLRPGMYANLTIGHDMGEGLLVPESAIMRTGERSLVFRALPEGRFEPVEVQVGSLFGDRLQILSGLTEGEKVIISAAFLIDSESRLKATMGGGGHHHHGG
jgi:Cu(I)/Ag(I) efflux system membrane fusion protein